MTGERIEDPETWSRRKKQPGRRKSGMIQHDYHDYEKLSQRGRIIVHLGGSNI
jgi:hypothetical protein